MCDVSDLIQKYYTEEIWAKIIHEDLSSMASKYNKEDTPFNVVIDDWRRLIESDYFQKQGDFNVIKVYLDKEGVKQKASKGSSHYENNIKPEDCDICFTYKKDYSNFEEIIGLIQNAIK